MSTGTCVFVTPQICQFGAEKSLLSLVSYIKKQGNKVLVIIPEKGPIIRLLEENEIPYIVEKFASIVNYTNKKRLMIGTIKRVFNYYKAIKIGRILKNSNVKFVHTNSVVTDFGVLLSEILKCNHYQHIREFADLDFHMTFELGKKDLLKIQKKSAKIICVSKAVEDHYRYLGNNLCTVYNGVSLNNSVKNQNTKTDNNFRMVLAGRLGKEKGHYLVLDAMEYLNSLGITNVSVDFYGAGSCEKELRDIVNRKGLTKQVNFCGFVSKIPYKMYDVGLMCSDYEAFGRVTVEYMLAGLPVIGSDSGATPELVRNGKTGILYKAFDYKALAHAIETLANNRSEAKNMGIEGFELASSEFSERTYLEGVTRILFSH